MKPSITKLLNKKMSRTEFLKYFGLVIVTALGIPSLLKNLSSLNPNKQSNLSLSTQRAFGSGPYGV